MGYTSGQEKTCFRKIYPQGYGDCLHKRIGGRHNTPLNSRQIGRIYVQYGCKLAEGETSELSMMTDIRSEFHATKLKCVDNFINAVFLEPLLSLLLGNIDRAEDD